MTITLYGIPNCDTIKKARRWLDAENIEYRFHDFRKDGIDSGLVEAFCQHLGWEKVLNKRGTTYRQLTQAQKDNLNSTTVIPLLVESPAMIKRPVLVVDNTFHLGFSPEQYTEIFA
ncbi:Regulatory protein MgsR [Vibrio ruber DSM 16370]|uniref:Regulatory protein MgsR n=1 Tax=Vibrio ruber (strain DSM 16370 / JCM 11486 / BCRC 17186 / CECT 7878 / LMG 23124 / VR1) TaxID=1123498 RepID=A0A1R4LF21_VIBR1|nr:ArsC family reductase [Vibrio ruber]SJN54894.1 Regulatory protein MgsR [Vibrio ruber DSM 16370]